MGSSVEPIGKVLFWQSSVELWGCLPVWTSTLKVISYTIVIGANQHCLSVHNISMDYMPGLKQADSFSAENCRESRSRVGRVRGAEVMDWVGRWATGQLGRLQRQR